MMGVACTCVPIDILSFLIRDHYLVLLLLGLFMALPELHKQPPFGSAAASLDWIRLFM